jgi:hypothetical protein
MMASGSGGGSLRDRTDEFFRTVDMFQQQSQGQTHRHSVNTHTHGGGHLNGRSSSSPSSSSSSSDLKRNQALVKQQSQFTQAAQHVMRGIHSTSERLGELTLLTKQTTLFNDDSSKVNELSRVSAAVEVYLCICFVSLTHISCTLPCMI